MYNFYTTLRFNSKKGAIDIIKKSLAQRSADAIYNMIINEGKFAPGMQLPNENDLAAQLGISRATLRESNSILAAQGILEVHRGRGTFVAKDVHALRNVKVGDIDSQRIRLRDLYETRLLFEPEMAALACLRATDAEIKNILQLGAEVENIINRGEDRTEIDQAFHRAIVEAAHNDFLLRLIPVVNRAIAESIELNPNDKALAEDTIRDHALVMEFLQKRDATAAKQAMSIHIRHAFFTLGLDLVN